MHLIRGGYYYYTYYCCGGCYSISTREDVTYVDTISGELNEMFYGSVIPCYSLCDLRDLKRSQTFLSLSQPGQT